MSQILKATVTMADATGRGTQRHIFWCRNTSQWILCLVLGSDLSKLRVYYNTSPDFTLGTWAECSGSPYTFTPDGGAAPYHDATGCHMSGWTRPLSNFDSLHLDYVCNTGAYLPATLQIKVTAQGVISVVNDISYSTVFPGGFTPTTTPIAVASAARSLITTPSGYKHVAAFQESPTFADEVTWSGIENDTWTPGTDSALKNMQGTNLSGGADINHIALFSAGQNVYLLMEDGQFNDPTSMGNVQGFTTNNTSVTNIFTALGAGVDPNDFTGCQIPTGAYLLSGASFIGQITIHCVLRTGSNTYTHKKNTSSVANTWVAGGTIPNQTSKAGAGMLLATNEVDLWLFIIDTDAANTVRYCKYTTATGAWDLTWTAFETSTKVRSNLAGNCEAISVSNYVPVIWTEVNGVNWDVAGKTLQVTPNQAMPLAPTPNYHQQYRHARM